MSEKDNERLENLKTVLSIKMDALKNAYEKGMYSSVTEISEQIAKISYAIRYLETT